MLKNEIHEIRKQINNMRNSLAINFFLLSFILIIYNCINELEKTLK